MTTRNGRRIEFWLGQGHWHILKYCFFFDFQIIQWEWVYDVIKLPLLISSICSFFKSKKISENYKANDIRQ